MSLFVNVTDDATAAWTELRLHFAEGDFNANYIRRFEVWITSISSEDFIRNHPARAILTDFPLPPPTARNQIIPEGVYALYITFYEKVLRDIRAIGGFQYDDGTEGEIQEKTVDPFAEYHRK